MTQDTPLDQLLESKLHLDKKIPNNDHNRYNHHQKDAIDMERERERERILREREREKAAAQVSSKKKVEQRISTMTEAQIMEKLRKFIFFFFLAAFAKLTLCLGSVVSKGDPNDCYKKVKRVGQG